MQDRVRGSRMQLFVYFCYLSAACAAVTGLSGCGNAMVSPAQYVGPAPSSVASTRVVDLGFTGPAGQSGNETMNAKSTSGHCGEGEFRDYVELGASGRATGPYPGTFSLVDLANVNSCPGSGGTYFTQTFSITSRADTVTGTASGVASYHCPVHFYCYLDAAVGWKYSATVTRNGKVLKTFSGSASEGGKSFAEILYAL